MEQVKINKILSIVLVFIFFSVLLFFGVKQYQVYMAEKQVESINEILEENLVGRDSCKPILDFDKTLLSDDNKFFNEVKYDDFREKCDLKYNIVNAALEEEFCVEVIKKNKEDFLDKFIILDAFSDIKDKCIGKFLKVEFSTGSFFDIEQDFKSSVNIDFSLDFYEDKAEEFSDEYIENRTNAKSRLISLLEIEPKINVGVDDIILYKKRAILNLRLQPETEYKFSLKSFETSAGEETEKQNFVFTTPENKFFGFKVKEKVSLFQDTQTPNFTFYRYNDDRKEAKIKICRIDNEAYAKIEVYDEFPDRDFRRNFFKKGIDKIDTIDCKTKTIDLTPHLTSPEGEEQEQNTPSPSGEGWGEELIKKEFNFSEEIGDPARSGLYFVTFENSDDREYNNIIQKPIFFGIIDSHITMKISANGEAFFFVNDFNGNPLANQDIRVYLNDFKAKKRKYNYDKDKHEIIYYSPFEKNVLSKAINLGKTGYDGILKVDLKGKIDDAFSRTFDSWDYSYTGNLNSLFVTSASKNNLSYVSSKHNGGITPWNFGYSIGGWWYGENSENQDEITLQSWGVESEIYSHIFTDRKLYLPGEEVNIKAILRNSADLSIPRGKEVNLIVRDSKKKELINKNLEVSNFGSFSETLNLAEDSSLGNYYIELKLGDKRIGNSGFSVEVFKNPKFKTDVMLETEGLNKDLVKITETKINNDYYYQGKDYLGDFKIKARISSKYYNGAKLKNAEYKYRVFKQYYYDNSYWDECYYGCYWEPDKELYTEGKGVLDENGNSNIDIPVKFESSYSDYKYIVEVTVKDAAGDTISSSNSIIARLPGEYKKWDPDSGINFSSPKRFYKSGEKIEINGSLNHGKYSEFYDDKFLLIIKKKDYESKQVKDVRGYTKSISKVNESVEKIILVNSKNFVVDDNGKLKLDYIAEKTGEYVFEFGKINNNYFLNSVDIIKEFKEKLEKGINKKNDLIIKKEFKDSIKVNYNNLRNLVKYCDSETNICSRADVAKKLGCSEDYINDSCRNKEAEIKFGLQVKVDDLIDPDSRKFFTIISYGDTNASNPVINDNKLQVLTEKISYHVGEKAKILIRLPESEGKILLTREKQGVIKSELIDVKTNIFFKEFLVDDSFVPNTYISALFIPKNKSPQVGGDAGKAEGAVPEYKVGYSEIVVDKTDKKAFIEIKSDKKVYKPRETVKLDINVSDINKKAVKSELTVMVVDDSLISLMGNVDLNSLEKFYKKLPFRIQTAITNIAMLKNYYFTRRGIVGGSGFDNFKGGDSAVSSRNIFKNTAYYNPEIITDNSGNAHVEFELPDNLTNFRVMVVSNSLKNFFGMSDEFIEVRKNVIVEDKTPLILRNGDIAVIGAQVFNTTLEDISFKIKLKSEEIDVKNNTQNIVIKKGESKFVTWKINVANNIELINYKISAIGNSKDNSDSIENKIEIKQSPALITNTIHNLTIPGYSGSAGIGELNIKIPENIDINKSKIEVLFSNNKLIGIEKIVSSLAKYPYGCIEQTISSTLPNAILLKFSSLFGGMIENKDEANKNLIEGIKRIKSMQLDSGAFSYWQGDTSESGIDINSYVLRSLVEMKKVSNEKTLDEIINNSVKYLSSKFKTKGATNNSNIDIFYSLSKAGVKGLTLDINSDGLSRHDLLNYTHGLSLSNKTIYKTEIDNNIYKLKEIFKNNKTENYNYSFTDDKAVFLQLLLEVNYDQVYIDELISELYLKDWSSYYYSTKTKNNTFIAFSKYLQKYGNKNKNNFGFAVGNVLNRDVVYSVGGSKSLINKFEYNLSDVIYKDSENINLKVANLSSGNIYSDIIIKGYPEDILKVKKSGNKVKIRKEIYEVTDETELDNCTSYWRYYSSTYSSEHRIKCDGVLKKVENNSYKKGSVYRVKITADFDDRLGRNFVMEDYLAGTFRVINSKFKTESSLIRQESNNWGWEHIEYRPEVVMAHTRYLWSNTKEFSYYVRAEFPGIYTQPPATGYFMYNPIYRANSEFNIIEVK